MKPRTAGLALSVGSASLPVRSFLAAMFGLVCTECLYFFSPSAGQNAAWRSFPPKENTMKFRVILSCTLLLLAASPSFALPLCGHCNEWNACESAPGDFERCKFDSLGNCITTTERCSRPFQGTVLTDWQVVSIEISRPALDSATVTAPAAVAEVPTQTPRATELK